MPYSHTAICLKLSKSQTKTIGISIEMLFTLYNYIYSYVLYYDTLLSFLSAEYKFNYNIYYNLNYTHTRIIEFSKNNLNFMICFKSQVLFLYFGF